MRMLQGALIPYISCLQLQFVSTGEISVVVTKRMLKWRNLPPKHGTLEFYVVTKRIVHGDLHRRDHVLELRPLHNLTDNHVLTPTDVVDIQDK